MFGKTNISAAHLEQACDLFVLTQKSSDQSDEKPDAEQKADIINEVKEEPIEETVEVAP